MNMLHVSLIALCLTAGPAPAQEGHQPPSASYIVAKMQSNLDLTQDQVAAVTPIVEKYAPKLQDLRQRLQDGSTDKQGVRSQMKQLRSNEAQELSQVLSDRQLSQWKQMQGERHGRHDQETEAGTSSSEAAPGR